MKFGKFLQASRVKGWEECYLDYKRLVKAIKAECGSLEDVSQPLSYEGFNDEFNKQIESVNQHFASRMQDVEERAESLLTDAFRMHESRSMVSLDPESIVKLRKYHRETLQVALREVYQDCLTLKQVCSINFTGFVKALKKFHKRCGDASSGSVFQNSTSLRQQHFYKGMAHLDTVADRIEQCYATHFKNGDVDAAQRSLRHIRRLGLESHLTLGIFLGACLCLLAVILWLSAYSPAKDICPFCTKAITANLPVYRILFIPLLWLWCWSGLCYIWKEISLNYPYILSINPYTELGYERGSKLAAYASLILLADFALFLASVRTGFEPFGIPVSYYPLAFLIFLVLAMLAPRGVFYYKSRTYFYISLSRIVVAPFGPEVRFVDNYIADVLTSMAIFLRDVDYTTRFYGTGAFRHIGKHKKQKGLELSAPIITALPYWFRLQQCIRRFYDSGPGNPDRKVHLLNACKYLASLSATCLAAVGNYTSVDFEHLETWTVGRSIWFSVLCISTLYAYLWDVLMDWGLFEANVNGRRWIRWQLRSKRLYRHTGFYYWALLSNFFGRIAWALTITPHGVMNGMPAPVSTTLLAVVELLRRAQWSLLRLENEYLSNSAHYRSVKDVPMLLDVATYGEEAQKTRTSTWSGVLVGLLNLAITCTVLYAIYLYRNYR